MRRLWLIAFFLFSVVAAEACDKARPVHSDTAEQDMAATILTTDSLVSLIAGSNDPGQADGTCTPVGQTLCNSIWTSLSSDASNCGACGQACPSSACVAGVCQLETLASGQRGPAGFLDD